MSEPKSHGSPSFFVRLKSTQKTYGCPQSGAKPQENPHSSPAPGTLQRVGRCSHADTLASLPPGLQRIFSRTLRGLPLRCHQTKQKKHGNKHGKPRASMGDEILRSKNGGCWGTCVDTDAEIPWIVSLCVGHWNRAKDVATHQSKPEQQGKTRTANLACYELSTNCL